MLVYIYIYIYYHILPRYFSSALQRVDLKGLPHQPCMVTKQIHKLEKTMDRTNDNTCRLFRKIHATSITSLEGLITLPLIFYPSNCRKSAWPSVWIMHSDVDPRSSCQANLTMWTMAGRVSGCFKCFWMISIPISFRSFKNGEHPDSSWVVSNCRNGRVPTTWGNFEMSYKETWRNRFNVLQSRFFSIGGTMQMMDYRSWHPQRNQALPTAATLLFWSFFRSKVIPEHSQTISP